MRYGLTMNRRRADAMKRTLIIVVAVLGILYLGDFLSLRLRIPARDMFGSVTVHTCYVRQAKEWQDRVRLCRRSRCELRQFRVPSIRRQAVLVRPPEDGGTDQH